MTLKKALIIQFFVLATFTYVSGQQSITSAGNAVNSNEYSISYTIGEVLNNYGNGQAATIKNGVIQPYNKIGTYTIETDNASFDIFPNPAKDFIEVSSFSDENTEYTLYDATSKIVKQGKLLDNKISLAGLSEGSYIVQLRSGLSLHSELFLKF